MADIPTPQGNNSGASLGGTLAGSIGSGLVNLFGNYLQYQYSKNLTDYNYQKYFENARKAGATPAAIAAGITGSHAGFSGSASSAGNPMPDLGATMNSQLSSRASMVNAGANKQTSDTDKEYKGMLINYQPSLFRSQAFEATAKAWRDIYGIHLDNAQRRLMDEQADQISLLKPWKVSEARQTFLNLVAEHDKIIEQTRLFRKQQKTEEASAEYYRSGAEKNYSDVFKTDQEAYTIMWENDLRSLGFDPHKNVFQNMIRNSFTKPQLFDQQVDGLIQTLQLLDYQMQTHVNKHYKEFGLGFGVGSLLHNRRQEGLHNLLKIASVAGTLL